MLRRKHSVSVARLSNHAEEELNPSAYISNLADCMLVLAVGLMVALVSSFGIDLAKDDEASTGYEVEIYTDAKDPNGEDIYEELGVVYRDKETGMMYIVETE